MDVVGQKSQHTYNSERTKEKGYFLGLKDRIMIALKKVREDRGEGDVIEERVGHHDNFQVMRENKDSAD